MKPGLFTAFVLSSLLALAFPRDLNNNATFQQCQLSRRRHMIELFKIVWDLVVLRDAARGGQLNWRIWPVTFGFVLVEYWSDWRP
jgi:hypothetical protein